MASNARNDVRVPHFWCALPEEYGETYARPRALQEIPHLDVWLNVCDLIGWRESNIHAHITNIGCWSVHYSQRLDSVFRKRAKVGPAGKKYRELAHWEAK